eukprot:scaffold151379_cov33-Tisochrysis_lutea.AAC.4
MARFKLASESHKAQHVLEHVIPIFLFADFLRLHESNSAGFERLQLFVLLLRDLHQTMQASEG